MNQPSEKYLIINADDLGHSTGINRGIEECHRHGIVTSASLMVNRPATQEGVAVALRNPGLSVGLHVNLTDENPDAVDLSDAVWAARELQAQHKAFCALLGRAPTHLDSHHHIHWRSGLTALFQRFAAEHHLPLRHYSKFRYEGGFYGQWEHGITDLTHIRPAYLCELIGGLPAGLHEIACHPGYASPDLISIYHVERAEEVRTLTDPSIKEFIRESHVRLCSFS